MSIHWKINTPVRLCPQANCLSTRPPFVEYKQILLTAINMLAPVICTRCFVIQRYAAAPPNGFSRFTFHVHHSIDTCAKLRVFAKIVRSIAGFT